MTTAREHLAMLNDRLTSGAITLHTFEGDTGTRREVRCTHCADGAVTIHESASAEMKLATFARFIRRHVDTHKS